MHRDDMHLYPRHKIKTSCVGPLTNMTAFRGLHVNRPWLVRPGKTPIKSVLSLLILLPFLHANSILYSKTNIKMPSLEHLLLGVAAVISAFAIPPRSLLSSTNRILCSYVESRRNYYFPKQHYSTDIMAHVLIDHTRTTHANNATQVCRGAPKPGEQPLQFEEIDIWDLDTLESEMTEIFKKLHDPCFPKPDCSRWAIGAAIVRSHTQQTKDYLQGCWRQALPL